MIKAVIIDDEIPAIMELEYFLKKYQMIETAGTYTNPLKALEEIATIKPQIVFLDINMPQLMGIDAASKILDLHPDTEIIFVTAYDQYAIEAFELNALDYVLKPISKERFDKTIERVIKKIGAGLKSNENKLSISCFGKFQIGRDSEEPVKWRTEKTKELFVFLLNHHDREISKDQIVDELWGDTDSEKAIKQLHSVVYYIRKTLDEYGIDRSLISISGNYCMKLGDVDFDLSEYFAL